MDPSPPTTQHPLAEAIAAIAIWSTFAALGIALSHVPAFLLAGIGLLIGGAVGLRGISPRETRPAVIALGIYGLFAYHFCLFLALRLAPPVEANLLNYLWPLLIVVLSPLVIRGTRLRPRHVGGAALGFLGAGLLVTGGRLGLESGHLLGHGLAVAAAFIWATYSLLTKRIARFPTSNVSLFCLASGALSLACHAVFEPRYAIAWGDVPYLLAIGLGPMGVAFYLWDRAMKGGDPRRIGTLAYLTPLLSTGWIVLSGQAPLTPLAGVALLLIVGGAALGAGGGRESPPEGA